MFQSRMVILSDQTRYYLNLGGTDEQVTIGNVLNMGTGDMSYSCWINTAVDGWSRGI